MSGSPDRLGAVVLAAACGTLLMAAMWVASQAGLWPQAPARYAAIIYLLLESLPILALFWLGAAGYGYVVRLALGDTQRCAIIVQAGAGMAVMLLVMWAVGWAGLLNPLVSWGLIALGTALLSLQIYLHHRRTRGLNRETGFDLPWTVALAMPPLGLILVACLCPPGTLWAVEAYGYDVLSYHLQLPREWLATGAVVGLEHNVYSYLPSLIESGYAHLAALRGSVYEAIYLSQLWHASLGAYAAVALACLVGEFAGRGAAAAVAATCLAVPWVLITGSSAYNEMGVLAFGAAGLLVVFDVSSERWRGAALVGLFAGMATLSKLTAGPMIAAPLVLLLLTRGNHALRWRKPPEMLVGLRTAVMASLVGLIVISPYLVRNTVWTGNPVFPFATGLFGKGHWDDTLAARWDAGHSIAVHGDLADRPRQLVEQWLLNTGYGAVLGGPQQRDLRNVARFDTRGGFPLLWTAVAGCAVLALMNRATRRAAVALLIVLTVQLGFWLTATHLQSRFLLPTLLPTLGLLGLGAGRLEAMLTARRWWTWPSLAIFFVGSLTASGFNEFYGQTVVGAQPWEIIDALPPRSEWPRLQPGQVVAGDHLLNHLPYGSRTLLVADSARLLYIRSDMTYASAFDHSPLGRLIREHDGQVQAVTQALRQEGYTHVWVHWSELHRLHATYGHDPDVTEAWLRQAAGHWRVAWTLGDSISLFALP